MDCPRLAIKRGAVTEFWCWTVMRVRVCTCVVQMKNEDEEALGVLGKPGSVAAWSSAAPTSSAAKSSMKFLGPSNLAFHNLRLTRLLSCRHTSLSLSLSFLCSHLFSFSVSINFFLGVCYFFYFLSRLSSL